MYHQAAHLLYVFEAHMLPALACIGGFKNSLANSQVRAVKPLARSDIHDVGIGGRHCDVANGAGGFAIENRAPGAAIVVCLPNATVVHPHVKNIRLRWHTHGTYGAARPERADHAPTEVLIMVMGDCLCNRTGDKKRDEQYNAHPLTNNFTHETEII